MFDLNRLPRTTTLGKHSIMTSGIGDHRIRSQVPRPEDGAYASTAPPGAGIFSASALHTTVHYGTWRIYATDDSLTNGEHIVLVKGSVDNAEAVLCRVASSCITSLALDSAECDCREQMTEAMSLMHDAEKGVLLYLDQEGRGHGLTTKIRALANKNVGMDTFAAVEALGMPTDVRSYDDVLTILKSLSVRSIALLTNNPAKATSLREVGIDIAEICPIFVTPHPLAHIHQEAKRRRGHTV